MFMPVISAGLFNIFSKFLLILHRGKWIPY